jgi:hypothetical protein
MNELKERCNYLKNKNAYVEILSTLTLAPISWSIEKTSTFFNVTEHQIKRSRMLKKEKGILGIPDKHFHRTISEEEKKIVTDFYLNDKYSRMQPGMKDVVSVKVVPGEKKIKLQKKLLLLNIDELYAKYKDYCVAKLCMKPCGKSKFYELRPKNVIEVGASGAHNECVCEKHENVKLMIDAISHDCEKLLLMDKLVCDVSNPECMLNRCDKCLGNQQLMSHVEKIVTQHQGPVKFKQWESTDRNILLDKEMSLNEFINLLVDKVDKLTTHHFISKKQSKYIKELKENLPENVCLLHGDFSQNYSMIAQNSTQGSFFNPPPQATLHTFLAYITVNGKSVQHPICVISDCTAHNTVSVHSSLNVVLTYLKELYTNLKKVIHFTDGAASQYKNFKNFINLLHHKHDFNLDGEWHFFATSHGKGPCDGIGGTLKRLARRASLQMEANIQTPQALFQW